MLISFMCLFGNESHCFWLMMVYATHVLGGREGIYLCGCEGAIVCCTLGVIVQ